MKIDTLRLQETHTLTVKTSLRDKYELRWIIGLLSFKLCLAC